jgi:hypothetical protein
MVSFAEFLLIFNANENIIHVLKKHYHKASSHSDAGVRYSHLIPHTVPYRIALLFFFHYRTGKRTLRTTFSLRSHLADVRYDFQT